MSNFNEAIFKESMVHNMNTWSVDTALNVALKLRQCTIDYNTYATYMNMFNLALSIYNAEGDLVIERPTSGALYTADDVKSFVKTPNKTSVINELNIAMITAIFCYYCTDNLITVVTRGSHDYGVDTAICNVGSNKRRLFEIEDIKDVVIAVDAKSGKVDKSFFLSPNNKEFWNQHAKRFHHRIFHFVVGHHCHDFINNNYTGKAVTLCNKVNLKTYLYMLATYMDSVNIEENVKTTMKLEWINYVKQVLSDKKEEL